MRRINLIVAATRREAEKDYLFESLLEQPRGPVQIRVFIGMCPVHHFSLRKPGPEEIVLKRKVKMIICF